MRVLPSAGASLSALRGRARQSLGVMWLSGAFLVAGLAIGVVLSAQWQEQALGTVSASSPITRQSGREIVASTIARLEGEQADLKAQISDLRLQLGSLQSEEARRKTSLLDINREIDRQRIASGVVALRGPGIVVVLNDSATNSVPANEDPANYIIHEYDLRDVLNTLWIAGAEAISLNDERIVSSTSLYCVGTTVICNATRLSPPYEIRAIGDPQALAAAVYGFPQMEKLNQRAQIYDLPITVSESQDVLVPAYNGSFVFKYATVEGQK